ncbi:MAG TPA: HAMP domain-containing histidine kinase [Candidatus Scybalocola faecavium]|nr:HAMP domain-containing histidine kinase [Candidatus Scybalocola faecavium]
MNKKIIKENMAIVVMAALGAVLAAFVLVVWNSPLNLAYRLAFSAFAGVMAGGGILLWKVLRRQVMDFSDDVCAYVDQLSKGKVPSGYADEDTLMAKLKTRLDKLADRTVSEAKAQASLKAEIQKMVSDISHQLKTPIANITMYSAMLKDEDITPAQRDRFSRAVSGQAQKLGFLVDVLAKMSRMESGLIHIKAQPARIYDTIAAGVMEITTAAQKKGIRIRVECDEHLIVYHDVKWTREALFNIMDNGVKYTPNGGTISITVSPWELFTRIDIADTGIGISPEHFEDIFKRFYRESKVHLKEGAGIGLYLSREIISRQGGYIQVRSKENEGSVFSIFLPNQDEPAEK